MCFTCVWIPILLVNSLKLGNIQNTYRTGNGVVWAKIVWRCNIVSARSGIQPIETTIGFTFLVSSSSLQIKSDVRALPPGCQYEVQSLTSLFLLRPAKNDASNLPIVLTSPSPL
jgi:hypothetical protein